MLTVKIIIPWPTPKKSQDCKKKKIWRPKKEDTMVMCQRPFEKSERLMITEYLIKN